MKFLNTLATQNKNSVLLLIGKLISLLGTNIFNFAISYHILEITKSPMSFGISILITFIPRIILSPFVGEWADRQKKKNLLAKIDFLSFFALIIFILIYIYVTKSLYILYGIIAILSILSIYFNIVFNSSMTKAIPKEEIKQFYALNEVVNSISFIVSPIVAGLIYSKISLLLFVLINALSFFLSGVSELFIIYKDDITKAKLHNNYCSEITSGFTEVFLNKSIFILFISSILFNFLFNFGYLVPLPFMMVNTMKFSSSEYGMVRTAFSVGSLLGSLIINKYKFEKSEYPVLSTILMAIFLGLMWVTYIVSEFFSLDKIITLTIVSIVLLFFGCFMIISNILLMTLLQNVTADNIKGKVFGVMTFGTSILSPLGIYISSSVIEKYNFNFLPFLSGVFLIISVIIFNRYWKIHKDNLVLEGSISNSN